MRYSGLIAILLLTLLMFGGVALASPDREADRTRRMALRKLCRDADNGNPDALYRLAYLHDTGYDSIPVDTARSTYLYTLAADKGHLQALNYLGYRYYTGQGVARDIEKGLAYMEKAAEAGNPQAASNIGYLLLRGDSVNHDVERAAQWLERAADAGVGQSQAMLADLLSDGHSLPADTLRAAHLYTQAIENGIPDVQNRLLNIMRSRWQRLDADSMVNTGIYYYTHRAPHVGVDLFLMAADSLQPKALALLGDAATRAYGMDYDYDKSLRYFLQAALLDDPSAQFFIGETLEIFPDILDNIDFSSYPRSFDITPDQLTSGDFWLRRAASHGISDAEKASTRLLKF